MRMLLVSLCLCLFGGTVAAQCPNCPVPECPLGNPPDPYRIKSYEEAYAKASRGQQIIIVVGLPDRFIGTYQQHLWVSNGYLPGFAPGEYMTQLIGGRPYMSLYVPAFMPGRTCTCDECKCAGEKQNCPRVCPSTQNGACNGGCVRQIVR